MSELTGSYHRCRAQFKCGQTVVGQGFAGNGPKGLSYNYYHYYYYYYYYYSKVHVIYLVLRRHTSGVNNLVMFVTICWKLDS